MLPTIRLARSPYRLRNFWEGASSLHQKYLDMRAYEEAAAEMMSILEYLPEDSQVDMYTLFDLVDVDVEYFHLAIDILIKHEVLTSYQLTIDLDNDLYEMIDTTRNTLWFDVEKDEPIVMLIRNSDVRIIFPEWTDYQGLSHAWVWYNS